MVTQDLTKVNLKPKSLIWLTIAFTAVLVIYGVSAVAAEKVRDMLKGATKGVADKSEELF